VGASLAQNGIEMEERDFFKERFTEKELRALLGDTSASEIFSWRSPSFRKTGLERENLSEDDLIRMMIEEPRLIRRPLLLVNGKLVVGTDKAAMAEAFPES
jgi:arsenate reductase-like glutaredoxin family protein